MCTVYCVYVNVFLSVPCWDVSYRHHVFCLKWTIYRINTYLKWGIHNNTIVKIAIATRLSISLLASVAINIIWPKILVVSTYDIFDYILITWSWNSNVHTKCSTSVMVMSRQNCLGHIFSNAIWYMAASMLKKYEFSQASTSIQS